jgi:hypothetical protein
LFSNRGPAARRRRQRNKGIDATQRIFSSRKQVVNTARKGRAVSRLYKPRTLSKDNLTDNKLPNNDRILSNSPSDMRIRLSESTAVTTDIDESRAQSTVSVKKIRRSSMAQENNIEKPNVNENIAERRVQSTVSVTKIRRLNMAKENNTEKPIETENMDKKPINNRNSNENLRDIQRSAMTVFRMNKVSNMDETEKKNSNAVRQGTLSAVSTIPSNTTQVNVIKIPRNKTSTSQRRRASSVGNVSIIHLEKPSVEIRSIADRSKTSASTVDGKQKTSNGVIVTKLSKKSTAAHSDHS